MWDKIIGLRVNAKLIFKSLKKNVKKSFKFLWFKDTKPSQSFIRKALKAIHFIKFLIESQNNKAHQPSRATHTLEFRNSNTRFSFHPFLSTAILRRCWFSKRNQQVFLPLSQTRWANERNKKENAINGDVTVYVWVLLEEHSISTNWKTLVSTDFK